MKEKVKISVGFSLDPDVVKQLDQFTTDNYFKSRSDAANAILKYTLRESKLDRYIIRAAI